MISPDLLSIATDTAFAPMPAVFQLLTGNLKKQTLLMEPTESVTLRHHKGAFVGCFSLRLKRHVNWEVFKEWKKNRNPEITGQMARDFIPFIRNHYDVITTAPPSGNRCPLRYCAYDLAREVSRMSKIPFVPAFAQKTDKTAHGRHASLAQTKPRLLDTWNVRGSSILFVDDCITSGTTARLCCEALVETGNHVDGLIWVYAGG